MLALTSVLILRPQLATHTRRVLGDKTAGLDAIEGAAAAYLAAEQRLGRVAPAVEPAALALALVGVLQRLVLAADTGSDLRARLQQAITALVTSYTTSAPHQ